MSSARSTRKRSSRWRIIAGPGVYICDSCVNVCKTIIDREVKQPAAEIKTAFRMIKPTGIKKVLDDYVIGQEHAKKVLSVADHRGPRRLHLRLVRQRLQDDHRPRGEAARGRDQDRVPHDQADGHQEGARRLCHRPGAREKGPLGGGSSRAPASTSATRASTSARRSSTAR